MEFVLGALPSLLPKLSELLADEYKLQKEVKVGIMFISTELESMKAALEDMSEVPADQLPRGDKIWARNVRELSYDIEDNIDTFMVKVKDHQPAEKKHGFMKFIEKTLGFSLMQPKIRRKIAIDIRDIKKRVIEVSDRRRRYEVPHSVDRPVNVDPRALVQYERDLVGIEESREEVIKILNEGNEASEEQNTIVSIVGFGGLGKTTLANAVYEKLKPQFDCSAFVSVSQTPDIGKVLQNMLYLLTKENIDNIDTNMPYLLTKKNIDNTDAGIMINGLRKFLRGKRYLVIIDDIWDTECWKPIRYSLPDDSVEYRIITTTRNFNVAKEIGGVYKMKPLSFENSKILMYARIFGKDKDKCPDEQLEEVSNRILKKCDGVPLAITTIASLLASKGRNKFEWFGVCNSIGAGLEEDNTIDNMRKVLLLSYYDMPSHLRTCLLYLSMFPEDYDIRKDRLIWLWIAEGFIQSQKQEKRLFEIGESYLNDLINRSMVVPLRHDKWTSIIESCRVHDMVLDLIRSLSSEENFITIQNNMGQSSSSKKVRRISFQNAKASHSKPEATLSKEHHVRSVIVFESMIDYIPIALENFSILRVLDLENCDLSQSNSLKYLGRLLHLRYLSLRNTNIGQLTEEIGNLQLLQMLDTQIPYYWKEVIPSLPSSILRLTQLMCLRIDRRTRVPEGIGSLIALEELSCLCIDYEEKMLEELAHLTKLRVLDLKIITVKSDNGVDKSVVECLNKLQKIQRLEISIENKESNLDGWVVNAPQNLRALQVNPSRLIGWTVVGPWFSTLPSWLKVNPSLLLNLSSLGVVVKRLLQEDLEILGRLPALRSLSLDVGHEDLEIHRRFVVGAFSFPCILRCTLLGFGVPVVFEQGAMPKLVQLRFDFPLPRMREINCSFDLGLENLPSLQEVYVMLQCGGASVQELEETEAALRHVIEVHPNHPYNEIDAVGELEEDEEEEGEEETEEEEEETEE